MSTKNHASARLRKVAILVASLDGALAAKLLADLSPEEVRRVEEELDRLDDIDPTERATVLAEFRGAVGQRGLAPPPSDSAAPNKPPQESPKTSVDDRGVEANFSAESEAAADQPAPLRNAPAKPAGPLETAEPATIAELLAAEHPQTIAIFLSRLDEAKAGDVFALLSPELQSDALDRLATLDEADPDALQEVERQFLDRLAARQREQARMAAGASLALKMLSRTDPQRRATLLTRLSLPGATAVDEEPALEAAEANAGDPAPQSAPATERTSLRRRLFSAIGRTASFRTRDEHAAAVPQLEEETAPADNLPTASELTARLTKLEPAALAAALAAAGQRTAQLALVASGDPLLKRLSARLPRRQTAALKKQLAAIGPTSLTELCSAQARVLGIAEQLEAPAAPRQAA